MRAWKRQSDGTNRSIHPAWQAAPDFGARRCFWHQTHVEAHERIAYPARSRTVALSLSLSAVPKPSSNSESDSGFGFACLAFQCALILRFCCYVALVVAVDTNGYERLINQMYMHDNVLSAPESELAACGRQLAD